MSLYEQQKEIQQASYRLLAQRIEKLSQGQSKAFAEASGMLSYIKALIVAIDNYKEKYLQEVLSKIIRENEAYYCELLTVEYKNIHKFLAQPLAKMCLQNKVDEASLNALKTSKDQLENLTKKTLNKLLAYTQRRIGLSGEFYGSLGEKSGKELFKEMPQRVALAIWQINSNDLALLLMNQVLTLKNIDDADAENTGNTRQSFGAKIGEEVHKRMAWRFFVNIEKVEKIALRTTLRKYAHGDFSSMEQLSKPLWTAVIELEVGQKLIDLAMEVNIVKEYTKVNDEKGFNYLKFETDFLEQMSKTDKKIAHLASMTYKPMVIEPLDWKGMYEGGFLADEDDEESRFDLSLIKASSRKDREALEGKEIPQSILDGINHLQKTAFEVNEKMLTVLVDYHNDINYLKKENRVDFAYYRILRELHASKTYSLSKEEVHEHFRKTNFIQVNKESDLTQSDQQRINKAIKATKKAVDEEQFKLESSLYYEIAKYKQGFDTIVQTAKEMTAYEKFYFVWRMDFRGRVYPQQTLLHPQAGDLPKSLLLFSQKKRLSSEGLKWFFIHGANCYGEVDKEPFENRVAWIKEQHESILASAKNHRETSFWKQAGDPWKFLAFCFEYAAYVDAPETFTTGLPVAIDGSNNGFQHISVLLKDTDGAKNVNVLPYYDAEKKLLVADLYAKVAEVLKEKMQEEYRLFLDEKDRCTEENGLFYVQKEELKFEASYYLEPLIALLECLEPSDLKATQFYSTYLREHEASIEWDTKLTLKDKDALFTLCEQKERQLRKVYEDDLEELKECMVEDLVNLVKRARRSLKKKKLVEEKGKVCSKVTKPVLNPRSVYQKFIDANMIKRGFVKSPVMTESYGSGTQGKAKKLLEDIEANGILSKLKEEERYLVALAITKLLEKALTQVSDSPQKYKKWMKNYAKEVADKSAIKWKTPLGLEVEQVEYQSKKVKVSIGGGRKVEFKVYTDEIDKKGHQNGFSPNYIHSLDATHLIMTINGLKKENIYDIVTVHDSFATHANDVSVMSKVLRESFMSLHHKRPLLELRAFFEKEFALKEKKIPYVDQEDFKLEKIMKSEYFFA